MYYKGEKDKKGRGGVFLFFKYLLQEYPSYAHLVNSSSEGSNLVFSPRCYCLISRYPFFRLHFAVLNDILGNFFSIFFSFYRCFLKK